VGVKKMNEIRYRLARPDLGEEEFRAVVTVLKSGQLIQGQEVARFEEAVCALTGSRYAIAVSSGTAALHVCLLALEIHQGDVVFVPSFAWPSAANVARLCGATPVLVDVLPGSYNIDPESLGRRAEQALSSGWGVPRLVMPVHQFGLPCDIEAVLEIAQRFRMDVLEDAACALGARHNGMSAGRFGRIGVFSFHPRKSITTGEGGMIVTDDEQLAQSCRCYRNHGQAAGFEFVTIGLNYRMTEFQAALGTVQMNRLPELLRRRKELVAEYVRALASCPLLRLPDTHAEHTWQTFMVVLNSADRDTVAATLRREYGVEAGIGSVDAHSLEMYKSQPQWQALPVSASLNRSGLALPLHTGLSSEDVRNCAEILIRVLGRLSD
jgi:perosamine synthetase